VKYTNLQITGAAFISHFFALHQRFNFLRKKAISDKNDEKQLFSKFTQPSS